MTEARQPILQANGISFQFPQTQVFNDFSASLPAGITYVTGDESTGKSTLLRLFAGDISPQTGNLAISGFSQKNEFEAYRKNVFWTDPRTTAYDQLSPNDFFNLQRKFYPNFDEIVLTDLIENISLTDHVSKPIYMLSAGSKRKVWLAAAFASGAAVTLLDEPFAALDQASIRYLIDLLEKNEQNKDRAWVIADYEVPQNLSTALTINLDV
jgi:ABC-type multidrug transport system ATPase subunit